MITRTMSPVMLRKEIQTDIIENILPYLKRNYDNKIRRAIVKSTHLPMIFNPIHYFSSTNKISNKEIWKRRIRKRIS